MAEPRKDEMNKRSAGPPPPEHSRLAIPIRDRPGFRAAGVENHELKADGWHLCVDGSDLLGLFVYPFGLFVTKRVIQLLDPQRFSNVEERRFSLDLSFSLSQFDSKLSRDLGGDCISTDIYQHPDPAVSGEIRHYSFPRDIEESLVARIRKHYVTQHR